MNAYRAQAEFHKALAHPVRLRILDILARREACVCHLTAVLGMRQPYVSQQLSALRDTGLVVGRREGTLIYYRLHDARLAALLALGQSLVAATDAGATPVPPVTAGPVAGCQCPGCHDGG
jgi:DNA-binding transcriptional ArsR family regulator